MSKNFVVICGAICSVIGAAASVCGGLIDGKKAEIERQELKDEIMAEADAKYAKKEEDEE